MKQIYFLLITIFTASLSVNGQNTVTVDGSANWLGFANVFETPANGGGYVFGSFWGIPDLKSTIGTGDDTVTLQPNFNTYAFGSQFPPGNPDHDFWIAPSGAGNKDFEANTFVEDNALLGAPVTFTGNVNMNTLDAGYEAIAFIKVFQNNFSVLKIETAPLIDGEDFVVEYTNVEPADEVIQYGFIIRGINANPANEAALGSVVVGIASDCDQDGILNAVDPIENYTVAGPVDTFISTPQGADTCDAFVNYPAIVGTNLCNGMDTFTVTQTEGLPSGSNFPVGTTTNTFEIENSAGTMETYTFDVIVVDGTDPVFDCPGDLVVSTDDSGTYTIEDYASIASDNCDSDLDITQEPAAGATIAEGESQEIVVTATDDAGNIATCSFTLTADSTLGLENAEMSAIMRLFPNPSAGQVTIEVNNTTVTGVTIYNMLGAKVFETTNTSFSVEALKTGTYFVQVATENNTITERLLVK